MHNADNCSFVGGMLVLDFANTAAGRDTPAPVGHLHGAADLIDWTLLAGGIDEETAMRARTVIAGDADLAGKLLRHAFQLRDVVYGIGAAIAHGHAPSEADLVYIKEFTRRSLGPAALESADGCYRFDFSVAPPEIALLGPIAWSAIDLLATGRFERLKQCANPDCGWLFLDHSKNNSRRWCDMATCGNVAKGRRHRQRRS
jgi:predicted RNA-binding Zn ribbon-like protein